MPSKKLPQPAQADTNNGSENGLREFLRPTANRLLPRIPAGLQVALVMAHTDDGIEGWQVRIEAIDPEMTAADFAQRVAVFMAAFPARERPAFATDRPVIGGSRPASAADQPAPPAPLAGQPGSPSATEAPAAPEASGPGSRQ